jgi:hypothetical protein
MVSSYASRYKSAYYETSNTKTPVEMATPGKKSTHSVQLYWHRSGIGHFLMALYQAIMFATTAYHQGFSIEGKALS